MQIYDTDHDHVNIEMEIKTAFHRSYSRSRRHNKINTFSAIVFCKFSKALCNVIGGGFGHLEVKEST